MAEPLVENMNQLPKTEAGGSSQPVSEAVGCGPNGKKPEMVASSSSMTEDNSVVVIVDEEVEDENVPLIGMGECRICQEEDSLNNLESPCACSGSLKYAHRKCVQHWCNEKGDITCEICHQQYQPGYTTVPRPQSDETTIDIGGVWQISGTPLDMHDPRLLAIAEAERQFFDADYDDYNSANSSGAAFCRSAALILMALLLLRHALSITDDGEGDGEDDASTFLSLFLLRAVGFLLPCYIMIWAISILQRRRQRQEAAALAATQFAIVVQSAQSRGLLVASAAPAVTPLSTPQAAGPSQAAPHQEHV
ncbi:RING/FYVE/PHD zinc finger superfamily protein [Perilla frutescens var. frutescens]|nr:RING/FYVE/PHD zinc finger superfamily protein [Perilla frutescens var. frutescens]